MTDLAAASVAGATVPAAQRARGYGLYLAGALLFALNGTVAKSILLTGIAPARLSQLRVTLAFGVLLLVVAVTRPAALRLRRTEILPVLAYGVAGVAMTQWLYFVAIRRLPVGVALVIEFTAPIMVALWFRFGRGQAMRRSVWLALLLALGGLTLVAEVWDGFSLDVLGVAAALGAAASLAVFYVLGERQSKGPDRRDAVSLTMWGFGAAALFWAVVQPWWSFPWDALAGSGHPLGADALAVPLWLLTAWMVVLGTVVPFSLVLASLRHLTAAQASVVGMSEPLMATTIAWLALGEVLAPVQLAGMAVVLAGIVLAETSR